MRVLFHALPSLVLPLILSFALAQSWTTLQNTSLTPRHEAAFLSLHTPSGLRAILLGGRGVLPTEIYNPQTNTWSSRPFPPLELHHFQPVAVGATIYIPSAWTGGFPREAIVQDFHSYDAATDTWSTRAAMPAPRRRGAAAAVEHKGKIYVSHGNQGGHGGRAMTLPWLDVYDIAKDTWIAGPDAPNARDHAGAAVVTADGRTRMCVAGGRDGGVDDFFNKPVKETDCFDFQTGAWEVEEEILTPRAGVAVGTDCQGRMWVAGGEGGGKAFKKVEVFDGKTWTLEVSMTEARHGSGLAFGGCECGFVYVASGGGKQGGGSDLGTAERWGGKYECEEGRGGKSVEVRAVEAGVKLSRDGIVLGQNNESVCFENWKGGIGLECVVGAGACRRKDVAGGVRMDVGRIGGKVAGKKVEQAPFLFAGEKKGNVTAWNKKPVGVFDIMCARKDGKPGRRVTVDFGCSAHISRSKIID